MKRAVIIIAIVFLICSGCSFFGIGQGREEKATEATFDNIEVKHFVHNRLFFKGTRKGETSIYIYDVNQKTLTRDHGQAGWQQESDHLYYLEDSGKIVLQSNDGIDSLVWTDHSGNEKEIIQTSDQNGLQFSVSPDEKSVVYWRANGNEHDLFIFDLVREKEQAVATFSQSLQQEDITWAPAGTHILVLGRKAYRVPDGERVWDGEGNQAVWSPAKAELLVLSKTSEGVKPPQEVDMSYGNQMMKVDMISGEEEQLFPQKTGRGGGTATTEQSPPLILDEPVWDQRGQFFAFVTGRVNEDQLSYEKVHIMDAQGGFHYVENEQNLRPSTIDEVTFSPNSEFFSYTAAGLLKVIYLPTQTSKVYDVYTQMQNEDGRYLLYNESSVWVMGNNDIKRLSKDLEEKLVYRSSHELKQFFVSANENEFIVIEREGDEYHLKFVSLLDGGPETK